MKKQTASRFGDIDFIEFSFLVSATIPPRPIARAMFWQRVIDKYYHVLTQNERDRLFEWINREWSFEHSLKEGNKDCLLFNARYDKNNQYRVHTNFNGEEKVVECFKWEDKYHLTESTSIQEQYITKIEKIDTTIS